MAEEKAAADGESKRRRRGGKGRSEGKPEKGKGKGKDESKGKGKGDKGKGKGKGDSKGQKGPSKTVQKEENAQMAQALLVALQCPPPKEGKGGKKKRGKGEAGGRQLLQIVTGQQAVPAGFDLGPPMPMTGKDGKKGKGKGKGKGKDFKGKGKGGPVSYPVKGKGKGSTSDRSMSDVTNMIEELCTEESVLAPGDFDYRSKRFLHELLMRADQVYNDDPANAPEDGNQRLRRAIELCVEVAKTKERDDVDNWRAYVSKLLRKEDLSLYDELKERDIRRRRQDE